MWDMCSFAILALAGVMSQTCAAAAARPIICHVRKVVCAILCVRVCACENMCESIGTRVSSAVAQRACVSEWPSKDLRSFVWASVVFKSVA